MLTSPLEVMKVRFQADSRSYKKYSCASRGATSSSVSGSSNGSSSANGGGGGGGGGTAHLKSTSSCLHTSTSAAAHHHASTSSGSTKSGLKSYVNILLRNNHGNLNFELNHHPQSLNSSTFQFVERPAASYASTATATAHSSSCYGRGILLKFRSIVENEGFRALFKGLGPNIVGVVPYRAIYFFSYANSKSLLYSHLGEEGPLLHIGSAFVAGIYIHINETYYKVIIVDLIYKIMIILGFAAVTITNPIWFIKTRLQVDETRRGKTTMEVINKILKEKGPLGFYKGISASYFGITESALYFVIYEKLKSMSTSRDACSDALPITCYLTSAGFAKTLASCICYPHGNLLFKFSYEYNDSIAHTAKIQIFTLNWFKLGFRIPST